MIRLVSDEVDGSDEQAEIIISSGLMFHLLSKQNPLYFAWIGVPERDLRFTVDLR